KKFFGGIRDLREPVPGFGGNFEIRWSEQNDSDSWRWQSVAHIRELPSIRRPRPRSDGAMAADESGNIFGFSRLNVGARQRYPANNNITVRRVSLRVLRIRQIEKPLSIRRRAWNAILSVATEHPLGCAPFTPGPD